MRNSAFLAIATVGALVGSSALAQGPVYSVNIVGFQKVSITNVYTQVSNPFVQADADINEVIGDQLTGGEEYDSADNVLVWTGSTYKSYFLADTGGAEPTLDGKWIEIDGNGTPVVANEDLPAGVGFWVKKNGPNGLVTLVGDVEAAATRQKTINAGFNMISYPYSTSATLNSAAMGLNLAGGSIGGEEPDAADNIYVWNGTGYESFFLVNFPGDPSIHDKWCFIDGNGAVQVSTYVAQPGQAFWYRRVGTSQMTWTTAKPY